MPRSSNNYKHLFANITPYLPSLLVLYPYIHDYLSSLPSFVRTKIAQHQATGVSSVDYCSSLNNNFPPPIPVVNEILQKMFPEHRLSRNLEWKGGFGQSGVYLVRRYKGLREVFPAAVKIAPTYLITREKVAYDTYIDQNLPQAVLLRKIVYTDKEAKWAGLHYEMAGEGVRKPQSLQEYLQSEETRVEDISEMMKSFLESMFNFWNQASPYPGFSLRDSYDHVLPVNLIIKPVVAPSGEKVFPLTPQMTVNQQPINLDVDSYVRLEGFEVVDVNPYDAISTRKEYTLNHPTPQNDNEHNGHHSSLNEQLNSYRLRLIVERPFQTDYSIGKVLSTFTGQVINTRTNLLNKAVQAAFNGSSTSLNLDDRLLPLELSNRTVDVPNPLKVLTEILDKEIDVRVTYIHGDLQVENIQVLAASNVKLIDFADARNDHVLHDLLRLETSLVTKWLSKVFQENGLSPSTIYPFYELLHYETFSSLSNQTHELHPVLQKPFVTFCMLREAATNLLRYRNKPQEYYDGLTIYLLGALKFKELDPFAHQVAFWGAATSQHLVSSKKIECDDFFAISGF